MTVDLPAGQLLHNEYETITVAGAALTIAGEAPIASRALAMMSMDTKLVMHCTSGFCALSVSSRANEASEPINSSGVVMRKVSIRSLA